MTNDPLTLKIIDYLLGGLFIVVTTACGFIGNFVRKLRNKVEEHDDEIKELRRTTENVEKMNNTLDQVKEAVIRMDQKLKDRER